MNNLTRTLLVVIVIVLMITGANNQIVQAENNDSDVGYIEIIGVPDEIIAGKYDPKTGIFEADLREITGAYVKITYDEIVITGKMVTWYRSDDYLVVTDEARVVQDDLILTSDQIEYYSELEELVATNNVQVTTDDAVVTSQFLEYSRHADRAEFKQDVVVDVTDGKLYGQHFVMLVEAEEMQFIGSFTGEFQRSGNNSQ